ncbi:DUF2203 domain-containing protein [Candidatus Woesearchaeota archaeon]|nr:DUF2203 domain-containing protein [Candidatus Woesearchaeota archaeon]
MNNLEHGKIYFTIEEVQKLLPVLTKPIKKLMKLKKSLELYDLIDIEFSDEDYEEHLRNIRLNKQFHKLHYEFFKLLEELEGKGLIVKDLDLGLVDFFSTFEGKEILLCWKVGEDKVRHWHEIDEGYGERKPIFFLEEELAKH